MTLGKLRPLNAVRSRKQAQHVTNRHRPITTSQGAQVGFRVFLRVLTVFMAVSATVGCAEFTNSWYNAQGSWYGYLYVDASETTGVPINMRLVQDKYNVRGTGYVGDAWVVVDGTVPVNVPRMRMYIEDLFGGSLGLEGSFDSGAYVGTWTLYSGGYGSGTFRMTR